MSNYALPAGVWRREAKAEITRSLRLPQFLVPTVLTPAAFFALFALALNKSSPEAATVMLAGYGVFAATGPALFGFGAGVAMEREQGLIELKRVSPLPAGAYVAAKLAAALFATALAMVLIDAVVRLLPGALGAEDGAADETFADGLLEYPQYTRPRVFRGMAVPEVLLSGDHPRIARWRREQSEARSQAQPRPTDYKSETRKEGNHEE